MNFMANPTWFKLFGILGAGVALLGSVIAASVYSGKQGQRYSTFNHFISELGEVGVSRLAPVFNLSLILSGLALLIIGNGFFKPNISVMVGNIYEPGDPKRDAGFNIFYMGINVGAFVANLLAASVRNEFGWLWTFRVAGIGILVGLVIMLMNWKTLDKADRKPERVAGDTGFGAIALKILLPAFTVGVLAYFMASAYLTVSLMLLIWGFHARRANRLTDETSC